MGRLRREHGPSAMKWSVWRTRRLCASSCPGPTEWPQDEGARGSGYLDLVVLPGSLSCRSMAL